MMGGVHHGLCWFMVLVSLLILCTMPVDAQQTQMAEPSSHGYKSSDLQIAMSMKKVGRLHEVWNKAS